MRVSARLEARRGTQRSADVSTCDLHDFRHLGSASVRLERALRRYSGRRRRADARRIAGQDCYDGARSVAGQPSRRRSGIAVPADHRIARSRAGCELMAPQFDHARSGGGLGGYEDGYASCDCFWGTSPGSLIRMFIETHPRLDRVRILDLGCGEGKNAAALARAGAQVVAVDSSLRALENGQRAFGDKQIEWHLSDARSYLAKSDCFDAVVMYGLLHCLPSSDEVASLIQLALEKTRIGGYHFVVAFNDGPHDLSAHPRFLPTLLPHIFYIQQYSQQKILSQSDSIIHETHPHNQIYHFHSLTRIFARKE
jgi:tellurite methyltransferase